MTEEQKKLLADILAEYQDDLRERFSDVDPDSTDYDELEDYCREVEELVATLQSLGIL